jgi:hypothetical protein
MCAKVRNKTDISKFTVQSLIIEKNPNHQEWSGLKVIVSVWRYLWNLTTIEYSSLEIAVYL